MKPIREWMGQNPQCPYHPVFTKGNDPTGNEVDKDCIIFFAETGARLSLLWERVAQGVR